METIQNDKVDRLREIACEIDNFRLEQEWPDTRLYQEVRMIGSTKTFRKLVAGDASGLNIEAQLHNYESALLAVKNIRAALLPPEPVISTFRNVQNSISAVARAWNEPGLARCVLVSGHNGTGKSTARAEVIKQYPTSVVNCEADETWRDSLNTPYGEIIEALNLRRRKQDGEAFKVPIYPPARQSLILEELNKSKRILIIDESHRMGPRGLNMITTLINKSMVVPVLFGLPVLMQRLFTNAYEEAIQLTGNRLAERVTLDSPEADEVLQLFEARGVTFDEDKTTSAALGNVVQEAPKFGNWRFVIKVHRECFKLANGKALTAEQFTNAFTTARRRCVQEQKKG